MSKAEAQGPMTRVTDDPSLQKAVEAASEIMRHPSARVALDRLCCRVYEVIQDEIVEDADLGELVRAIDAPDALVLTLGWMLGHSAASAADHETRQRLTHRSILMSAIAAGWSVELNHRQAQKAVN